MTRWLLVLLLAVPAPASAQAKRPLNWDTDTTYVGPVTLQNGTTGAGDIRYSKSVATRMESATLLAMIASSSQDILEWSIPYANGTLTGTQATLRRNLGRCALAGTATQAPNLNGLYWDPISDDTHPGHLYCTSNVDYDTDPAIAPVLSRSYIDETMGKLVSEGQWQFQRRTYPYADTTAPGSGSDKGMSGNVVPVPDWWRATHPGFGRLAGTAPGYQSGVTTGPAFMTTGIAAFDPPATGSTALVVAKSMLGHPFGSDPAGTDRTWRNTLYHNDYGDLFPRDPTDHGFAVWGDFSRMVWIDTPSISSPVSFETWNEGRVFYGKNSTPPTDGKPAALNSEFGGFYVRTYNPESLGFVVFGGVRQDKVQGLWSPLRFPGVPYPMSDTAVYPGFPSGRSYMPNMSWRLDGAAFEPSLAIVVVLIRPPITTTNRVKLYLFRVIDTVPLPPGAVFDVTLTD